MAQIEYEILINPENGVPYWDEILHLVTEEKWFNTPNDYQIWTTSFSKDRFQLFVSIEKNTERFIGAVTLNTHELVNGEQLSSVGMFIVHPDFRGKRVGLALFNEALKHGAKNKTLIAVPAMSDKYAIKFGFDNIGTKMMDYSAKCSSLKPNKLDVDHKMKILSFEDVDWDKLAAYDKTITGIVDRRTFLKAFVTQPGAYFKAATNEKDEIVGICNIRTEPDQMLALGPFYADTFEIACTLLHYTLKSIPNLSDHSLLRMAASEVNEDARKLFDNLTDCDFSTSHHFTQFTEKVISIPFQRIYSITENDLFFA